MKDALKRTQLAPCLGALTSSDIFEFTYNLRIYLYYWVGKPTEERIHELRESFPLLDKLIDFSVVMKRLKTPPAFEHLPYGIITISHLIPELVEVYNAALDLTRRLPNGVHKAECWLRPIAKQAGANADVEAAVYFASRGQHNLITPDEIRDSWYSTLCKEVSGGGRLGTIPEVVRDRAETQAISLSEAASVLSFRGSLDRLFAFRDEEEDFIDPAMFRAAQWFGITGFEPWLQSLITDLSVGPQGGLEHGPAGWALFYWCRSDLALQMAERHGLAAWLWALVNGAMEQDKPWRVFWAQREATPRLRDYVPLAGIIPFMWHRIKPSSMRDEVIQHATNLLYQTQTRSGGWPLFSDDTEPCLLATCAAIHGLALHRPSGWAPVVARGAQWLLDHQEPEGCWYIQGGPPVMLTVLALDAIDLAYGKRQVTFSLGSGTETENVSPTDSKEAAELTMQVDEPSYDFSDEEWYTPVLPTMTSVPLDRAHEVTKPQLALIVATETELRQALRILKPLPKRKRVWRVVHNYDTYYLGRFGAFETVVVLSSMGSTGVTGATLTADAVIREWNPKAVILVGIAFGANRLKHRPGDVLIAETVIPYESQRMGSETVFRNPIPPSSATLVNRFRNSMGWSFQRPDGTSCSRHVGPILSGDKLVDSPEFKNALLSKYPNAIGGEMEGAGFWSAAQRARTEWIIVKAVCDWADGRKHDEYHGMAAAAAVSLCHYAFSDQHALDGI